MRIKFIRSVISLSLIGAMLLSLCSCAAAPAAEPSGNVVSTAVREEYVPSPLMGAYTKAQANSELIAEAAAKNNTAVLTSEADQMLETIQDIRAKAENEFEDARETVKHLGNDVISARQKNYEEKVLSSLREAEEAAKGLKSNDQNLRTKSAQTIASLFAGNEEEEVLTLGEGYRNIRQKPMTTSASAAAELTLPTEEDLSLDKEVVIDDEIKAICDKLGSARNVYEFVRNTIIYTPYYHSKKGAIATFEQRSGNDADQASLLIGMLRYLGIPARYAQGNVFITKEQAVAITGAASPEQAGSILAAQYKPVIMNTINGELAGFTMEQLWVQAYVPYTDYRGVGKKTGDSVWVSMDPSFKEMLVEQMSVDVDTTREHVTERTQAMQTIIPDYEPAEQVTVNSRSIKNELERYMPVSLPYEVKKNMGSFSFIPDGMKDRISVSVGWSNLISMPVSELYGKSVTVSFEPETEADQQLIKNSGGIDKVAAYLVSVVPTITVDGVQYKGKYPVSLGSSQPMNITLTNASGTVGMPDTLFAGSVYSIIIDMQEICQQDLERSEARVKQVESRLTESNVYSAETLGPILDFAGKWYFTGCDTFADMTALSLDINRNRQLGIAVTGYNMTRESLFGYINHLDYGNFTIDVDYNSCSAISYSGDKDAEKAYMLLVGTRESDYEGELWQELLADVNAFGISTVSLFSLAAMADVGPVVLTSANLEEDLAECHVSDMTKNSVRNFVNQGRVVLLIPEEITVGEWQGSAYVATDMTDGSAAYMITGGLAGGSTEQKTNLRGIVEFPDHSTRDTVVTICTQCSLLLSKLQEILGWVSLASHIGGVNSMSMSVAGLKIAADLVGDTKDLAEAELLYFGTLDNLLDYFLAGSEADKDKIAKKILCNTVKSIVEFVYDKVWDKISDGFGEFEYTIGGSTLKSGEVDDIFDAFDWSDIFESMFEDDDEYKPEKPLVIEKDRMGFALSAAGWLGLINEQSIDFILDMFEWGVSPS